MGEVRFVGNKWISLSGVQFLFLISQRKYDKYRIYHGCMMWIEKSVTRVIDRHQKAC